MRYASKAALTIVNTSRGSGGRGRGRGSSAQQAASRAKKKAETKARKVPLQMEVVRRSARRPQTQSYTELSGDDDDDDDEDDDNNDDAMQVDRDEAGFARPLPVSEPRNEAESRSSPGVRKHSVARKISYDDDTAFSQPSHNDSGSIASTPSSVRSGTPLRRTAPHKRTVTWVASSSEKLEVDEAARSKGGGRGDTPHPFGGRSRSRVARDDGNDASTQHSSESEAVVRDSIKRMSLAAQPPPKMAELLDGDESEDGAESESARESVAEAGATVQSDSDDDEDDSSACISRASADVIKYKRAEDGSESDESMDVESEPSEDTPVKTTQSVSDAATRTTGTLSELFDSPVSKAANRNLPDCFTRPPRNAAVKRAPPAPVATHDVGSGFSEETGSAGVSQDEVLPAKAIN